PSTVAPARGFRVRATPSRSILYARSPPAPQGRTPRRTRTEMSIAEIFETMEYGPAPESASPAVRWLEERGRSARMYVDGAWRDPEGDEWFDSVNPATSQPLARVAQGGRGDVDAAVAAAR